MKLYSVRHPSMLVVLCVVIGLIIAWVETITEKFTARAANAFGEGCKAGDVRSDNALGMKLVWCPPGSFRMGNSKSEGRLSDDEDQVDVTLSKGFWIGQTSVTQQQWNSVMTENRKVWSGHENVKEGDDYPASYVNAKDAERYVKALNTQESAKGRLPAGWHYALPTEAQREYAARAGTTTEFSFGDDFRKLSDYGWSGGLADGGNCKNEPYAHRVAQKKPNPWNIYDMHGNLWEWCQDMYSKKLPGGTDPVNTTGINRVVRGGAWYADAVSCRSADRSYYSPESASLSSGFRVVLER